MEQSSDIAVTYRQSVRNAELLAKEDPYYFAKLIQELNRIHKEQFNDESLNYDQDYTPKQKGFGGVTVSTRPV